jgi:hypothetical protein
MESTTSLADTPGRVRWTLADKPIAEEFLPLHAPIGLEAYLQRDPIEVLDTTPGRIALRGWGPFRHPVVELEDGAVWLDFIGACRNRSPLRH